MEKLKLKIHQYYQDYVYWIKVSALATIDQKQSLHHIKYKDWVPKTKKQKTLVVDFHKIIEKDNREYEQVLMDLLSPVEESISW